MVTPLLFGLFLALLLAWFLYTLYTRSMKTHLPVSVDMPGFTIESDDDIIAAQVTTVSV